MLYNIGFNKDQKISRSILYQQRKIWKKSQYLLEDKALKSNFIDGL